jgi:hypothetical protein
MNCQCLLLGTKRKFRRSPPHVRCWGMNGPSSDATEGPLMNSDIDPVSDLRQVGYHFSPVVRS